MAELYLLRTVAGFCALDDAGKAILRKIKVGKTVQCEIKMPRNLKFHRQFFALLNVVWSATDEWASVEDLLVELKIKLGITKDVVIRESGEIVKILGSISFAKMDQVGFEQFYEGALKALCKMAGGIQSEIVREEVLRQLSSA